MHSFAEGAAVVPDLAVPVFGGLTVGAYRMHWFTPDGRGSAPSPTWIEGAALAEGRVEYRAGLAPRRWRRLITLGSGGVSRREGPVDAFWPRDL